MDIEFHYYLNYLIAVRAGYPVDKAQIIDHASQGVDDNHVPVVVNRKDSAEYENQISQTMDITRPHDDANIYPLFHFIPGDPNAETAARVDGMKDPMVTTPDGDIARQLLESALASGDPYRIGVASHAYVDTWAHQNFLGKRSDFNRLDNDDNVLDDADIIQTGFNLLINVGHGAAKHKPDIPALIWIDPRLVNSVINNRDRFLEAASHLFRHYVKSLNCSHSEEVEKQLISDLKADIGEASETALAEDNDRIARYKARALTTDYGATSIPDYDSNAWFNMAMIEERTSVLGAWKERVESLLDEKGGYGDLIRQNERMPCTWRNADDAHDTSWFLFQEAVKSHFAEARGAIEAVGINLGASLLT